jgi:hypothetical protein
LVANLYWAGLSPALSQQLLWTHKARRGEQIFVEVPGKKFARQNIAAAKCENRALAPSCYEGTCNSELFFVSDKKPPDSESKEKTNCDHDNASIHKSMEVRRLIEKAGCHLIYQPLYSPDLNPIEHFWSWIEGKIRPLKTKFPSLADTIQYALS